MKKHIFAFICIFMILFNTFAYTPTKAMDIGVAIDVGSDVLYYGWDMLNSLINGFSISLAEYSGYADKAAAMGAYYDDWQDVLLGLTNWFINTEGDEIPAISMQTAYPLDYGMTNAVMRDFINQYGGFVYDPTQSVYAPINTNSIAAWNRFQDGWVKRYLNEFEKNIDVPVATPDQSVLTYIDNINGTGFDFIKNINQNLQVQVTLPNNTVQSFPLYNDVLANRTFYTYANNGTDIENWNINFFSGQNTALFVSNLGVDNIYISLNSNTNKYTCTLTKSGTDVFSPDYLFMYNYPNVSISTNVPNRKLYANFRLLSGQYVLTYGGSNPFYSGTWSSKTLTTDTISEMFALLQKYVRNANIYVNGELWAYGGITQEPLVTAPDVIVNETGDIIGNDVWFPEQDLKADLVKFTELIDDKILTGDTLTIDDVIDAGVLTDENGNIITQENRDEYLIKKSVSTVIADALADDPTAGFIPDAPLPPVDDPWNWQFPTIVIPEGGDSNPRSTGLSVLARIVNVTNQGLPAELITMFWGIAITLLILGIIKILHK